MTALFFSPTALLVATIWKEDIFQLKILHVRAQSGEDRKETPDLGRGWAVTMADLIHQKRFSSVDPSAAQLVRNTN